MIPKDKFTDRLKTLAALLIPTYVLQFTIVGILPKTYTLLAPHYLIFVSMVLMLILILIAAVSFVLVDRENHFQWAYDRRRGRALWHNQEQSQSQGKLRTDPENGDHRHAQDASSDDLVNGKTPYDEAVEAAAERCARWPAGFRGLGVWWTKLAKKDVGGYREHIALRWEGCALFVAAAAYVASVLAILLRMLDIGRNNNTV